MTVGVLLVGRNRPYWACCFVRCLLESKDQHDKVRVLLRSGADHFFSIHKKGAHSC